MEQRSELTGTFVFILAIESVKKNLGILEETRYQIKGDNVSMYAKAGSKPAHNESTELGLGPNCENTQSVGKSSN